MSQTYSQPHLWLSNTEGREKSKMSQAYSQPHLWLSNTEGDEP